MALKNSKAKTVDEFVAGLPEPLGGLVEQLRGLVRQAAPDLRETIKWSMPCYVGGSNVCSIMPFKNHVNVAFFRGAELEDPDELLEGTGKDMRHVKVRSARNLPRAPLKRLVRQAAALDQTAT